MPREICEEENEFLRDIGLADEWGEPSAEDRAWPER